MVAGNKRPRRRKGALGKAAEVAAGKLVSWRQVLAKKGALWSAVVGAHNGNVIDLPSRCASSSVGDNGDEIAAGNCLPHLKCEGRSSSDKSPGKQGSVRLKLVCLFVGAHLGLLVDLLRCDRYLIQGDKLRVNTPYQ